eukprot:538673-Alexandrium_andersonii.AAC.1
MKLPKDPQTARFWRCAVFKRSGALIICRRMIIFVMSNRPQTQTLLKWHAYQASSWEPHLSAHDTF